MHDTGARIRARRLDAGVSQRDLAQAVGISASYLNLIEHGRRRVAGKLLAQIADRLAIDPDLLTVAADAGLVGDLKAAARATPATAVEDAQAADLATRYPGWARLIAAQARQTAALRQRIGRLEDRLTHDPAVATALHDVISAGTAIRAAASILKDPQLATDLQARFLRNIQDDADKLSDGVAALIASLDAVEEATPQRPRTDEGR